MEDLKQVARQFLDEQFAIMRKHGSDPVLNDEQYEQAVSDIERTLRSLADPDSCNETSLDHSAFAATAV